MRGRRLGFLLALLLLTERADASLIPPTGLAAPTATNRVTRTLGAKEAREARQRSASKLIDQLEKIRETIAKLEKSLYDELRETQNAQLNVRKLSLLGRLQKKERELG